MASQVDAYGLLVEEFKSEDVTDQLAAARRIPIVATCMGPDRYVWFGIVAAAPSLLCNQVLVSRASLYNLLPLCAVPLCRHTRRMGAPPPYLEEPCAIRTEALIGSETESCIY